MGNRLVKIGKAAEMPGTTPEVLCKWEKTGELLPARKTRGGTRYYIAERADRAAGVKWPVHGATDRPRQPRLPGNGQDPRWCQSGVLPTHGPVVGPGRGSCHPQDRGCLGHPHRFPLPWRQRKPWAPHGVPGVRD